MTRASVIVVVLTLCGLTISAQAGHISAREAHRLASKYMVCYITGCGGVTDPIARGTAWEVPLRFGYAGTPHGVIRIDRATGIISYSYGGQHCPTVSRKQLAERDYELVHRR